MNHFPPSSAAPFLLVALVALAACGQAPEPASDPSVSSPATLSGRPVGAGLIYGRVTTDDGVYEGRLRFGADEEALWSNYFNAVKEGNRWASLVPEERLEQSRPVEIFGLEIGRRDRKIELGRPLMVRFGDLARIEAPGLGLRAILKNGTTVDLDRFAADDFADGVRVWDAKHGVVDLDEWDIRSIDFLAAPALVAGPEPLFGTVTTKHGAFTGLIQWDREQCLVSDRPDGRVAGGESPPPFSAIRSIARRSGERALVTLRDGRTLEYADTRDGRPDNRGVYVDDPRYGRVLVSWDAFVRVEFVPGGAGRAYTDFAAGRPITGVVTTRSGRRLTGRLVYDLDESETTETLDAPAGGVDYTIPFRLIASIAPPDPGARDPRPAAVTLASGEVLHLEPAGDLDRRNAGVLVFTAGGGRPEYVAWTDVTQIEIDHEPEP